MGIYAEESIVLTTALFIIKTFHLLTLAHDLSQIFAIFKTVVLERKINLDN